ncbi:MAG: hypothetical protein IID61_14890 [SAR324 cluster bacterium]|nr:hypothetical protein [SAR324 cluster bacterium]
MAQQSNLSTNRDDPTIDDASEVWRRIPPNHFYYDEDLRLVRPQSSAFCNHPDSSPMSVVLVEKGRNIDRAKVLEGHGGYGLVSFSVGFARSLGQGVTREPTSHEPDHAHVVGKKTTSIKRKLAKKSKWIVPPPANN